MRARNVKSGFCAHEVWEKSAEFLTDIGTLIIVSKGRHGRRGEYMQRGCAKLYVP